MLNTRSITPRTTVAIRRHRPSLERERNFHDTLPITRLPPEPGLRDLVTTSTAFEMWSHRKFHGQPLR